jgi:hypothetical protein
MWNAAELKALQEAWEKKPDWISRRQFARDYGKVAKRTTDSVWGQINRLISGGAAQAKVIRQSTYPIYDDPLTMEGDALILPDLEFPFHNADFLNRVLSLAHAWGITQCILAGDVLHFDSLSGWSPNFTKESNGGITAGAEAALVQFAKTLSAKKQGELFGLIGDIGEKTEEDGLSSELNVARRELKVIADLFPRADILLGNHEGRLLTALETALSPTELTRLLETPNGWKIAPYYFSYLDTVRGRYQVEHPKGASEGTARQLAAKYQCHVIMGHSHLLDFSWDISGKHHAIHAGHLVDELRLPYAAQRHTTRRAHKPGAVIVRDGWPWLLCDGVPWDRLMTMK